MQIVIQSSQMGPEGRLYDLYIDTYEDSLGFTVVREKDDLQIDFGLEEEEWDELKKFIDNRFSQYHLKKQKSNS